MNDRPASIPCGYILYARQFLDMFEGMPLLDHVLWTWLNCRASHRDGDGRGGRLRRGELLTTLSQLRDALSHRAGCSVRRPSKAAVYRALERARRRHMIETRRTTRGLIVTICDYDLYQTPASYERAPRTTPTMPDAPHDRQEEPKNNKKAKGALSSSCQKTFDEMDRERAARALARATEEFLADD
jgi:hypothetical protein